MRRRLLIALAMGLMCTALPQAASAQSYPNKTVTLVVPFSPGASNDIIGRYLAKQLTERWKQSVVVENKAGAGSVLGTSHVAKAKSDGSTLLLVSSTFTTSAASWKELPYDPVTDLQPVGMVAVGQMVVVTGTRVPLPTLKDARFWVAGDSLRRYS